MRLIFFALILTSQIAHAQKAAASKKPPVAVVDERFETFHLPPKDEATKDKSLQEFIAKFKKIIGDKDAKGLESLLSGRIKYSFGAGEETPKGFLAHHKLNNDPKSSAVWKELKSVIGGGGVFRDLPEVSAEGEVVGNVSAFVMPSIYATWPDEKPAFDFYEFSAVNEKDVPVYKGPTESSGVLEKVSYLVVRTSPDSGKSGKLVMIGLPSGKKGYIDPKFISSPLGYRASLVKKDGQWKLDFFIAGD